MKTVALDLKGWRNVPFPRDVVAFVVDGEPVDLTGFSFALDVRLIPGEGDALISLDSTSSTSENGVRIASASEGEIVIQIDQASMQAAYESADVKAGYPAKFYYDLLADDEDGFRQVWVEGNFVINPGVTI